MCKIGAQKCSRRPQERDQAYPFHSHRDPHQIATTAHLPKREQLRLLNKLLQERVLMLEASRGEGAQVAADGAAARERVWKREEVKLREQLEEVRAALRTQCSSSTLGTVSVVKR